MNGEQKLSAWIAGIVCVSMTIFVLGLTSLLNIRVKNYIENGYTRQTLQGYESATWVKDD